MADRQAGSHQERLDLADHGDKSGYESKHNGKAS